MREQRRLAVILSADVVGYSRQMGRDESGTLARLREHRKQRFEPTLTRYGGRLVKLTGDGALVEFPSAVDALGAAIEFQQAMAEANHDQPEDTRIVFRIGLHLGDLIVDDDDLYGDGVNVAARLESAAPPGGIVISGAVHEAAAGRLKAGFNDLGNLTLKNIERPVRAFEVQWDPVNWKVPAPVAAAPSIAAPFTADVPLTLPDKPSIAVLPFVNMSGDPDQEYFADGMVEDIITALCRFKSLFVIARNSSFTYKGKPTDIKQVGSELGVRYVLEGSVRKAGTRVRITSQLIDAETGSHLWADRFDSSLDDIFDLQDEVTVSVVGAIAPKLDKAEIERSKRKPVENLDAYDCFLRGMAIMHRFSKESLEEAVRLFSRAIELDPNFATPYGLMGRCYTIRREQGWLGDTTREEAEATRMALHVSKIADDDAVALCWAGVTLVRVRYDLDVAVSLVDRALAINPNLAIGWTNRGWVSTYAGQHEAAIEQFARALRLSPKDPEIGSVDRGMAMAHMLLERHEESLKWAAKAQLSSPDSIFALRISAVSNALAGRIDAARRAMAQVCERDPYTRVSNLKDYFIFRQPQDVERLTEGFRLAGLPE